MPTVDWRKRVDDALLRIEQDKWTFYASKYLWIIDDIVVGRKTADEIATTHGSADLVSTALSHVTAAVHGSGDVPPLTQGGWYERQGHKYKVAPEFSSAWLAAIDKP
jgi:hypothetical protein